MDARDPSGPDADVASVPSEPSPRLFLFVLLGIDPRVLTLLGKHPTFALGTQPFALLLFSLKW